VQDGRVIDRTRQPAYALHALVHVLDRAAEGVLADSVGISYRRYLTLLTLQRLAAEGTVTQRELATELGVSEPAASRAVGVLREAGWVTSEPTPGEGNRRRLALTDEGERLVNDAALTLETAFASLMDAAGVKADDILAITDPLPRTLSNAASPDGSQS
jgi:DNA-binding MarR family transcriptional regulator